ncbi:MAG: hypothetical protein JWM17_1429 [Actinobacteria bacterium]|nr:hypothetical protein [Actinomycetota bacterium]
MAAGPSLATPPGDLGRAPGRCRPCRRGRLNGTPAGRRLHRSGRDPAPGGGSTASAMARRRSLRHLPGPARPLPRHAARRDRGQRLHSRLAGAERGIARPRGGRRRAARTRPDVLLLEGRGRHLLLGPRPGPSGPAGARRQDGAASLRHHRVLRARQRAPRVGGRSDDRDRPDGHRRPSRRSAGDPGLPRGLPPPGGLSGVGDDRRPGGPRQRRAGRRATRRRPGSGRQPGRRPCSSTSRHGEGPATPPAGDHPRPRGGSCRGRSLGGLPGGSLHCRRRGHGR